MCWELMLWRTILETMPYLRSKVLQRHTWRRQTFWTSLDDGTAVLDKQVVPSASTRKSKCKTHQNFFIFPTRIVQHFGSAYREHEDHNTGTRFMIQWYRWSAIFTITHWLDSYGKENLRMCCLNMVKVTWECLYIHRKLQLFLSVYVDETNNGRNKPRTCRRCGQHCKSKSNWKTQRHYAMKYILDVLNGQHKSVTELWWRSRNCSRSCSAQAQMSKPKWKIPKTSQLGAATCRVPLKSVLNAFANWRRRRLTNFMKCQHFLWTLTR